MDIELSNYQVNHEDPEQGWVQVSGLTAGQAGVIYAVTLLEFDPSFKQVGFTFSNGNVNLNLENVQLPITLIGVAVEGDPPAPVGDFFILSGAFVTLDPAPDFAVELKDDGTLDYAIGAENNFDHGAHALFYTHPESKERRVKFVAEPSGSFTWDDQAFNPRRNYAFELDLINEKGQVNRPPLTATHAPELRHAVVRRRAPEIRRR